jgi:hypothetical protein
VLNRPDSYREFVDRNYRRFLEVGIWEHRARQILDIFRSQSALAGSGGLDLRTQRTNKGHSA